MVRQPAVADRFYPGNKKNLTSNIQALFEPYSTKNKLSAIAAISPHAGYMYSGDVAAETLCSIIIPETILVLGLNHHGQGSPIALSRDIWQTPLGQVSSNQKLSELLLSQESPIVHDETAHRYEHSVEVQIPFLQLLQPELSIVPIVFSHISYLMCQEAGVAIANAITSFQGQVLILASTDMTHYETRKNASVKDAQALEQINKLNPKALYDVVSERKISMCGFIPVTCALIAAKILGAKTASLIRYTDSGEVSGDTDQVVGYAGVIIS